ncbi:ankyrin repeat domain-containing protein [Legionella cardiaca]|uniref:Ankyrin repeat domain-containing protein n=1 Tax=Legionella cardiaca TaxID=1071983 RepID=A0ABY8AUQ5_9GAMM|nr:ankyrin repeat domain-containing protein [Legionella cardiaca]WED42862.1 ankyrin repeat domain-containing protein [Legionella cardiaca]
MSEVFYWREIIGERDILLTRKKAIEQLLAGEYKSLSLEKLHGISRKILIFSIRVNSDTRLLFTAYQGKLGLLGEVDNHDYHKNRFLRDPRLLKMFLAKLGHRDVDIQLSIDKLHASQFDTKELEQQLPETKEKNKFIPLDFYKQDFICLSENQNHAMETKLPAIVYGPAGSGKTCVAFFALLDYVNRTALQENSRPVVYVSRSHFLVEEMKLQFMNAVEPHLHNLALFTTYEELFAKQEKKCRFADHGLFNTWLDETLEQQKYKSFKTTLTTELVWHEFRIRSGYTDIEYIDLGDRQSSISKEQKEKRQVICQLYHEYTSHLIRNSYVSSELNPIKFVDENERHPLIFVDEAQDLSYRQLIELYNLAMNGNIAYFLGDHQILFDGKSRLPFLRQMFYIKNQAVNEHQLPGSYRCAPRIIDLANTLINLKYQVTGGASDKTESQIKPANEDNPNRGELYWFGTKSDQLKVLKEKAKHSTNFVVITSPKYIEEAKEIFETPLVFTSEDIKGLEKKTIVIWRPLDSSDAIKACVKLKERQNTSASSNRAKAGESDESYLPYFNGLITGVTRGLLEVFVVQDFDHRIRSLYEPLQAVVLQEKQPLQVLTSSTSVATTQEWLDEASTLLRQGNEKQARGIFLDILHRTEEEFRAFQQEKATPFFSLKSQELPPADRVQTPIPGKKKELQKSESKSSANKPLPFATPAKQRLSREQEALHSLMADFSEKRLAVVLSVFPWETILLQTVCATLPSGKSQTLLEFILSDLARTKLFIQVIINNHPLSREFINNKKIIETLIKNKYTKDPEIKKIIARFTTLIYNMAPSFYNLGSTPTLIHIAVSKERVDWLTELSFLGADVNKPLSDGTTPIYLAAEKGNFSLIEKLHEFGADLNKSDHGGASPVHVITENDDVILIEKIHKLGANLNKATAKGITPAYLAAQNGSVAMLKQLHRLGAHINKADSKGTTPLCIAVECGHLDIVETMHQLGIDFQQPLTQLVLIKTDNKYIEQPQSMTLAYRAAESGHASILGKLHEFGLDCNQHTASGYIPIHIAALNGHVAAVEELYKLGAATRDCNHAIYAAAQRGHVAVIEKFHEWGNDCNQLFDDFTPIYTAAQYNQLAIIEKLHEFGIDCNQPIPGGFTPLLIATQAGHIPVVDKFIEYGVDLNLCGPGGITAAHIAAKNGHVFILEKFFKLGADFHKTTTDGRTVAYMAAQNNQVAIIEKLYELGINCNAPILHGYTPLYIAAQYGFINVVETLLKLGADPNSFANNGFAPIHIAAFANQALVLGKLCEFGANRDSLINGNHNALHIAAQMGHVTVIEKLYELGMKLDSATNEGCTAVYIAAQHGHVDAVSKFHELGVNITSATEAGFTPIHIAIENGHLAVVEKFHELKFNINIPTVDGYTPAYIAAENGHVAIIDKFHEWGIDCNAPLANGYTPLHIAAENGLVAVIEKLHAFGYDLNKTGPKGTTAAYFAAKKGHVEVLEKLHQLGANLYKARKGGMTPLLIAIKYGQIAVIEKLLKVNQQVISDPRLAYLAVKSGDMNVIKLLLENKVRFDVPFITNQKQLLKSLNFLVEKNPSLTRESLFFNMDQFIERQGSETNISILPIDIAKITQRQDIIVLINNYYPKRYSAHSLFRTAQVDKVNFIEPEFKL